MQRLKPLFFEGEMSKRLEAERREFKRAEARLQNGLHSLEEAKFYCIDRMMKEQRRIQRDLLRIKNSYSTKKELGNVRILYPDNSTSARGKPGSSNITLPTIPGAKDHAVILGSEGTRMRRCYSTKAGRIVMPPTASLALQTQINDFLNGFSYRQEKTDGHTGIEEPQPSKPSNKLKIPPVNSISMPSLNHTVAKHVSISEKPTGLETANGRENQEGDSHMGQESSDIEANSSDQAQRQISSPQLSACQENPPYDPEFYAPDGLPRTIHTMPNFLEAFTEAKKARYIRHRTKTDDERELTISEIFGKRKQRLQDNVVKEMETSKEKSLTGKIPI